ncbi:unnamed protein product [Clonostachys rhizophaga]|uniref:Uncharacterized protein n=1 Tax=Clonostachys rhizophaga TaxID=160324 RepID=A0A9N9VFQ1_9HYPO|nr:unnamed protein product [Clonostachys rhizophaga]
MHLPYFISFEFEKTAATIRVANEASQQPKPILSPSKDAVAVKETCDSFTFESFTTQDAWELGHLIYARLLPFAPQKSAIISITLAGSGQILFQAPVGLGTAKDNEGWVARKGNTVLRWGASSWYMNHVWEGDEDRFRKLFSMGMEESGNYAIHGGGVPIRSEEDHGAIVDVIQSNWE